MSDILSVVGPALFVIGSVTFVVAQAIALTRSIKKRIEPRGPETTYIENQMNITPPETQAFIEANRRRWRG